MPIKVDISVLKKGSMNSIAHAMGRYASIADTLDYLVVRWIAQMTAVELHAVWERYVEARLVAALNHAPRHFLKEQNITGVTRISSGFASYIVRGGGRFFDFRSMGDIIDKANRWLGPSANPFALLPVSDRNYIDCLAAVRNCVVHGSTASVKAYKLKLKAVYGVTSAPEPDEFLKAKDMRAGSPVRNKSRIYGLAEVIKKAIKNT
jgi:hypothetical protein